MATYGINFQPADDGPAGLGGRASAPGTAPIQTALQLVNLRLPSVVGARSLAPQQLLQAPGGLSGGLDLIDLLRRLAQQSGARLPQDWAAGVPSASPGSLPGAPGQPIDRMGGGATPSMGKVPSAPAMTPGPRILPGDAPQNDVFAPGVQQGHISMPRPVESGYLERLLEGLRLSGGGTAIK